MKTHEEILKIIDKVTDKYRRYTFNGKFNIDWYYEAIIAPMVKIAEQTLYDAPEEQVIDFAVELGIEREITEVARKCELSAEETQQLLFIYYDFFEACEIKYPSPVSIAKEHMRRVAEPLPPEAWRKYEEIKSGQPGDGRNGMSQQQIDEHIKAESYKELVNLLQANVTNGPFYQNLDIGTPLSIAMRGNRMDVFELLLKLYPAKIHIKDSYGYAPIHDAAYKGCEEAIRLLVEAGAYINSKEDAENKTPLQIAYEEGHKGTVNILLSAGAIADYNLMKHLIGDKESARLLGINGSYVLLSEQEKQDLKADSVALCTDFGSLLDFIKNEENPIDDRITALNGFRELAKLAPSRVPEWAQVTIRKFEDTKKYYKQEENNNAKCVNIPTCPRVAPNQQATEEVIAYEKFGVAEDSKRTLINLFLECYGAIPDSSKMSEKKPQAHVNNGIEREHIH